jgi:hypothetical protein
MLGLASLLSRQGDIGGAREAFQRAIDSGSPDVAPQAMLGLASLLNDQGDMAGAQIWLEKWQLTQSGSRTALLTSTEAHILEVLDERVGLDDAQIASKALVPLGAVQRALKVLSAQSLVTADERDRYFRLPQIERAT